jgi:enoyl-CoA hydratase/carnithine racemase
MSDDLVLYDVSDRIATITLNRPEVANAQNFALLDKLDAAWTRAADDDDVKVIVLRGNGKHFSSGHDLAAAEARKDGQERATLPSGLNTSVERIYTVESQRYLGYSLKWRNIPKPSIAAVQGVCIAGGLLLAWPCDLIIASDDAKFSDPVITMGIGGVEYHGHTWELGARLAKEILFTARSISAAEAKSVGMVNQVVPREDLHSATRELALTIAMQDAFALRMAKRAVNHTLDVQGFTTAVQAVFDQHSLAHGNALSVNGWPVMVDLEKMKAAQAAREGRKG